MILEVHDDEVGNSLAAKVNDVDYDYQAEMWVQQIVKDDPPKRPLAKFVLVDALGERAVWEREGDLMKLVRKSDRFEGQWQLGHGIEYKRNHAQEGE